MALWPSSADDIEKNAYLCERVRSSGCLEINHDQLINNVGINNAYLYTSNLQIVLTFVEEANPQVVSRLLVLNQIIGLKYVVSEGMEMAHLPRNVIYVYKRKVLLIMIFKNFQSHLTNVNEEKLQKGH